ncbi:MAG: MBL fold metallo-hydrolase [Candidatus Aminicenantes bacterium]|nr:MBL fold metallo-hydrolase [Candidatus Aminicenantes bacterium]
MLHLAAWAQAPDTHVVLLGTGTPNPVPERMGPAVAVVSSGRVYLVDCGVGVVRRAVQAGFEAKHLVRVFVTHLHSDHTLGYPDLIFTSGVMGRQEPLLAFGPPGLRAMTSRLLKAWKQDLEVRLHGGEPSKPSAYVIKPVEIKAGEVYRDHLLRVIAFPVSHGAWKHAYGFRFEARDKIIVISGDTTFNETLIAMARGCDILIHEVYCQAGWEKRSPDWQRYHGAYHTSAIDLGRLAAVVRPKKLVLYHQLLMGATPEQMLAEIRVNYAGETIYGNDLDVIR